MLFKGKGFLKIHIHSKVSGRFRNFLKSNFLNKDANLYCYCEFVKKIICSCNAFSRSNFVKHQNNFRKC